MNWKSLVAIGVGAVLGLTGCKKDQIAPATQDVAFIKYYGHVLDNQAADIKALTNEDGQTEYLVLGSSFSYSENGAYRDFYLIKTDTLGNELWSRRYGDLYNDNGEEEVSVLVVDGDTQWVDFSYDEIARSLFVLADGTGYLLAGTRQRVETDANGVDVPKEKKILLNLVDLEGNLIQRKVIRPEVEDRFATCCSDELFDIKEVVDADGLTNLGFVLTGQTSDVDTSKPEYLQYENDDKQDILTISLSSYALNMEPLWIRTYGFTGVDRGVNVHVLNEDSDGDFLVVGNAGLRENGVILEDGILIRYKSTSGNINNTKNNFEGTSREFAITASAYDETTDEITALGFLYDGGGEEGGDIRVLQFDSDLEEPGSSSDPAPKIINNFDFSGIPSSIEVLPNSEGYVGAFSAPSTEWAGVTNNDIYVFKMSFNTLEEFEVVNPDTDIVSFGYNKDDVAGSVMPIISTDEGTGTESVDAILATGTFDVGTNKMLGLIRINSDLSFDPDGIENDNE